MNPRLSDEVVDLSEKIYRYAELGSEEFRSVKAITEMLSRYGFRVEAPYKEIETAFHAVKGGQGKVAVGFLCEYDALPNGHSCGHNLIAAWSVGAAIMLAEAASDVRVEVFGTPSEEGIGKYAGGKSPSGKEGVRSRPSTSWSACTPPAMSGAWAQPHSPT
ncbi:hypothetical protein [Thermogymnomonas acidicola]|uniref:hypothetical protein n=1 Tax=Thermogymnomonas acidicola TaxID=399579 RepID=UPI0009467AD4|nr:hypothetical protein [Thermogymnomonas acidicola]